MLFYRKFLVLLFVVLVAGCSSDDELRSSSGSYKGGAKVSSPAERYRIESRNFDTFSIIKNSAVDARANDRVFFGFDSSVLSAAAQGILDKQAKWLKKPENVSKTVTVEGHCDERGTREYNLALGDRRANVVKKYLISSGVGAHRISAVSYGKERPAVVGSNSAAWSENRRSVTIVH